MRACTLWLALCFALSAFALPAVAADLRVQSKPIETAFGYAPSKPLVIPLDRKRSALARTRGVPVQVISYGSGRDIFVNLALNDPRAPVTRAELARCAMSGAFTMYQMLQAQGADEDRSVRVSIFPDQGSGEYSVLLAEAVFQPRRNDARQFTFPGPAWKRVAVVSRIPTEQELEYIRRMQLSLYGWGIKSERRAEMRGRLTPEQDVELSRSMGIEPGTIDLAPLELKPLVK